MNKTFLGFNAALLDSMEKDGGLKTVQRMVDGEIDIGGLCKTLKITFKEVSEGQMVVECVYDPDLHSNPLGIANGGWHGAMIDNAAGYAGLSKVEAGYGAFTKTMGPIKYYRPVISGMFRAIGTVMGGEGNEIFCQAKILDEQNECYAESDLTISFKSIEEIRARFAALGL